MKKLISICAFLMLVSGIYAFTITVNGINYNTTSDNTVEVIGNSPAYTGSITIPSSVVNLGVTYNVTSIGDNAFGNCVTLASITIPTSVTSIGDNAFNSATGLTSISIPTSVTSIGINVFSYCTGLTSINVSADNSNYSSTDGVLFNKNKTTIISYANGKQGGYSIPSSVSLIYSCAFRGCTGLTSITIPSSVISSGHSTLFFCSVR